MPSEDLIGSKAQENPNCNAFDTFGSLSVNSVFDPGRYGKYPDGPEDLKIPMISSP